MVKLDEEAKKMKLRFKHAIIFEKETTQEALAKKIGKNKQQVSRAISGDSSPMSKVIRKQLAQILEIEI